MRIKVIGDSSSSAIGRGDACYPWQLARMLEEAGCSIDFINYAVPGFTSADAVALFLDRLAGETFDYLVVYLGNNEAAMSAPKGRVRPWLWRLKKACGMFEREQPPLPPPRPLPRYRWCAKLPDLTIATTVDEFRENMRTLARLGGRRGQVVLINPVANDRYPSGVGGINAAFFIYPDLRTSLAGQLDPTDAHSRGLADGVAAWERGDTGMAERAFAKVAESGDPVAAPVARCNLACCIASDDAGRAEDLLRSVAGESPHYAPIALDVLSRLTRDDDGRDALRGEAFEHDYSLYRVRKGYRKALAELGRMPNTTVLELEGTLDPGDFVDYCHPTRRGHTKIADALFEVMVKSRPVHDGTASMAGARYKNRFVTPDYAFHRRESLIDYYAMDRPIAPQAIREAMRGVLPPNSPTPASGNEEPSNGLSAYARNFMLRNVDHPAFTEHLDLAGAQQPLGHEFLNFPEFYLYRLLATAYKEAEACRLLDRIACSADIAPWVWRSTDYERLILRQAAGPLDFPLSVSHAYLGALKEKLINRSRDPALFRDECANRVKTVTFWYTREAFRYGTHSRASMLYPRWHIDRVLEGAVAALLTADKLGEVPEVDYLGRYLSATASLLRVHDHHATLYAFTPERFDATHYAEALQSTRSVFESLGSGRRVLPPHPQTR